MKRHQYRYWDGASWTDYVADDGKQSSDPMTAPPPSPAGVLRDFLVEHGDEISEMSGPLEFIDVLRDLVITDFDESAVRRAVQQPGRKGELASDFLEQAGHAQG
jgi:hypothetical protein